MVARLRELQTLGVAAPDHDERGPGGEVVLVGGVAGEDLAPVAAGGVAGLIQREEVRRAGRIGAEALTQAVAVRRVAVVRLAVKRAADERLSGAVVVEVL